MSLTSSPSSVFGASLNRPLSGGNRRRSGGSPYMGPPSPQNPSLGGGMLPMMPSFYQDQYNLARAGMASTDKYLNQQIGYQNQGYGLGQQELNSAYGYDSARLGLEQQALGIDRGAVNRQKDYYQQLYGIDTERYNTAMGYQNALRGYRGRDHGSTLHSLAVQASQVRDRAMREERDMRRQQTAAGAFTSQGSRDSARDIKADKDYGLTNVDIAKRQADTAYRRDMAGFDNTIKNLTLDFRETGLSNQEQQARLNDRLATLDIEARKLGISRDELASKLSLGLERLKLNHNVSIGQLMDAIARNGIQGAGNINQILYAAGGAQL